MRNGWHFPLQGLVAEWELFAKTGKSSSSVVILKSGKSEAMDIRAGGQGGFATPLVEFRTKESKTLGFTGNKFYGYRVRFYYKGTLVRTVANPSVLTDWVGADASQ